MGRMFFPRASIVGFASGGRDCSSAEEDDESGRLLRETRDSLWIGVEKARRPYVTILQRRVPLYHQTVVKWGNSE